MLFDLATPIGHLKTAFLIYNLAYTLNKEEPSNTKAKLAKYRTTVLRDSETFGLKSFCDNGAPSRDTHIVEELRAHGYEVEPKTIETAQGTEPSRLYDVHHPFCIAVRSVDVCLLS